MGDQQEKEALPPPSPKLGENCMHLTCVNQSMAKIGLIVDQVVWERKEFGKPAARLKFYPQNCTCKHSNMHFQKPAKTRLGYVILIPVCPPPPLASHSPVTSATESGQMTRSVLMTGSCWVTRSSQTTGSGWQPEPRLEPPQQSN